MLGKKYLMSSVCLVSVFSLLALSQQFDLSIFELDAHIRSPYPLIESGFFRFHRQQASPFLNDSGNNTLVIEKKEGNVRINLWRGCPKPHPCVDFQSERGTVSRGAEKKQWHHLCFTLTERSYINGDSENLKGHRVYNFVWDGNKLTNRALLLWICLLFLDKPWRRQNYGR